MKDLTGGVVQDHVCGAVAITDTQVVAVMKLLYERMKIIVKPSATVGLVLVPHPSFKQKFAGCQNVGVILCGGSSDLQCFLGCLTPRPNRNRSGIKLSS